MRIDNIGDNLITNSVKISVKLVARTANVTIIETTIAKATRITIVSDKPSIISPNVLAFQAYSDSELKQCFIPLRSLVVPSGIS